jgi:hypothetical protein
MVLKIPILECKTVLFAFGPRLKVKVPIRTLLHKQATVNIEAHLNYINKQLLRLKPTLTTVCDKKCELHNQKHNATQRVKQLPFNSGNLVASVIILTLRFYCPPKKLIRARTKR